MAVRYVDRFVGAGVFARTDLPAFFYVGSAVGIAVGKESVAGNHVCFSRQHEELTIDIN